MDVSGAASQRQAACVMVEGLRSLCVPLEVKCSEEQPNKRHTELDVNGSN